jgi:CheY-like chemotaxis protein
MSYVVIILDDHDRSAQATKREIEYWDASAKCIVTHTVAEAWEAFTQQQGNRESPIGFVVVDLLLEEQEAQGLDFIRHLIAPESNLPPIPILALSAHESMLDQVRKLRAQRVHTAKRSNDFSELQADLRMMIDLAGSYLLTLAAKSEPVPG